MKIKQKNVISPLFAFIVSCVAITGMASTAYADPAVDQVKCSDGTKVTAHKDDAKPNDVLNDKDYKVACGEHGYKTIDATVVCKDDSMQNVYKDLADPTNKLDSKDKKAACKGHGGVKPSSSDGGDSTSTGNSCGGVDTAILSCDDNGSGVKNNAIWYLLIIAINILSAGVGILAVGGIIYASILYTTAEDKQDQVNKSKDIITNVVIGLVAYALMWAGLNFLIPGGLFN